MQRRYWLAGGLAAGVLALDLATKALVRANMSVGQSLPVLGDFVKITFIYNRNAVFGLPVGNQAVYTVLSLAAVALIGWYWYQLKPGQRTEQLALAVIIGGALGNLIDRLRWGRVVDFIEMGYRQYTWPIYNVADIALTVGMCLLIIQILFKQGGPRRDEHHHAPGSTAGPGTAAG